MVRFLACGLLLIYSGCANHTRTGALVGTALGTGLGAVVGHQIGKGTEGAAIGALVGAGTGGLVGHAQDVEEERDNAITHARHADMTRKAYARAMTNRDIYDMHASGFSDSAIISAMRDKGGVFDTSVAGAISLKEAGVSEHVIEAMRQHNISRQ